jgi:hypothetical protein
VESNGTILFDFSAGKIVFLLENREIPLKGNIKQMPTEIREILEDRGVKSHYFLWGISYQLSDKDNQR